MRFVSKNANLRIVLNPGIPGSPIVGREAVPGVYVKFEDGVAVIKDEEVAEKMLKHPAFGTDFIQVEDDVRDPYAPGRQSIEPDHDVLELNFGHVGKNLNPKSAFTVTPEMRKAITEMAVEMAKEMAPKMAKDLVKEVIQDMNKEKKEVPTEAKVDEPKPKKTQKADTKEKDLA